MSIKWFRGAARKWKRKAPVAPKDRTPRPTNVAPVMRKNPLRKPKSPLPFRYKVNAASPQKSQNTPLVDDSLKFLRILDGISNYEEETIDEGEDQLVENDVKTNGDIVKIIWRSNSKSSGDCPGDDGSGEKCSAKNGKMWKSLSKFLAERTFTGGNPEVGIYGHSHPGCLCRLTVWTKGGKIYTVTIGG